MTLHVRHALIVAALAACGPGDGDESSGTTDSTSSASDSMSSNPSDPSASSFPPDPTMTTVQPTTVTPTTEPPTTTVPPTTDPPDPTTTSPTSVTTTPTTPTTVSTVTTEVTFTDSSFTDFTTFDPSDTDTETVFIVFPDSPPPECDIFAEDCPLGQKCMPFADQGSNTWNNLMCVPIMPDARKPGDACFVEDSGVSGIDNCEMHALCFDVDDNLQGTCVAMCTGSEQNPVCPPGSDCTVSNGGVLVLCLPTCDPLNIAGCDPGDVCVPSGDGFQCVFDASGEAGALFDECEFLNACDPGLLCVSPEGVPQCAQQSDGCCTLYCDLTKQNLCPPPLPCVPFFEQGQAPAGLEDVGVCFQQ